MTNCKETICRPGGFDLTDKLLDWYEESFQRGDHRPEKVHLLDVGCGEGATLSYLRGKYPTWILCGIDPALDDPKSETEPVIRYRAGAEEIPLPDSWADVVLMECSFSRMNDPKQALKEILRILKPDGRLLISDIYIRTSTKGTHEREQAEKQGTQPFAIGRLETAGEIRHRMETAGFHLVRMMDRSRVLGDWVAQTIMDGTCGSLKDWLGMDPAWLRKLKCGYYICLAEPARLKELIQYASEKGKWYSDHYSKVLRNENSEELSLKQLPLCTAEDLRRDPYDFLCVPPKEVARIITLRSSGSEGTPKRIFFTEDDLERTADFFAWGILPMVHPGDQVAVFMEGETHFSVGGLLKEGLSKVPAEVSVYGFITDWQMAYGQAKRKDLLIGVPTQIYRLAKEHPDLRPHSVLLSADHVADSMIQAIEVRWKCRVFTHWGMSETGYGGGVQCRCREGYHLRDNDLILEVIDPVTGESLPNGMEGELVLTTRNRKAMPLIRYRTGDLGLVMNDPCPCGSLLPRLARVRGRVSGRKQLPDGSTISLDILDELLYGQEIRACRAGWSADQGSLMIHLLPEEEADRRELLTNVTKDIRRLLGYSFQLTVDAAYKQEGRGKRRLSEDT